MSPLFVTKYRFCFLVALVSFFAVGANADMYNPSWQWRIVENNSGQYSTYASQLSVDVTPFGGSMVDFTFTNAGPNPSAITGIYVEDGTLLGLASVIALDPIADDPSRSGIVFGQPAHPSNMPGWSTLDPKFYASSGFSVGSGGAPDGVSPGESVVLRYILQSGKTFDDVITALNLGFTNPDPTVPRDSLRIGLHVQDIGQESDSLILTPVPGAWVLGMLGLGIAGVKLRRHA
ncbi:MAG: hypothetical protein ACYS0H_02415 [Planctomycetota bacterium]|jgi:hypothetical protein